MKKQSGFSLIELMIVVAVVAVLATLALPAFTSYVQKGRRAEAQKVMLSMANEQAFWRSTNESYATYDELGAPPAAHYNLAVGGISATGFTLTATAINSQVNDTERGTSCSPMLYVLNGMTVDKTASDCWSR